MGTDQTQHIPAEEAEGLGVRLAELEAALRREKRLVQLVFETTSSGILKIDTDGRIVSVNSGAEELLGTPGEEIKGRAYNDPLWHITDLEGRSIPDDRLPFRRVLSTGAPVRDVRLAVQWPDGRRVFLSFNAAPIKDGSGCVTAVVVTFDNITERISSQEKLKASERRYRSLFNSMQDAFSLQEIIHDEDGNACDYRFLEVNPAFEKMTGIPASEWIGRTVREVLPGTEAHWIQLCGEVAHTGVPARVEEYSQDLDRYYEVLAYRPAPNQCAALSTDVTERKRAQEALLQRSRLDATATLAGGVAHDLNNLMVGVLGNADLLRWQLREDGGVSETLDEIVQAGQQAGRLAQQLLSFSRPAQARTEVVDLGAVIDEMLRIQRSSIPLRITVEPDCPSSLSKILADPTQMVQLLMNLCINAVEAIDGAGEIRLRARDVRLPDESLDQAPALAPGRYVRLSVEDDGPGIPAAVRDRVFEPFFSTKQQGRGLGLAAVHGIVAGHEGGIRVSDRPGGGTTFDIFLPATDEVADAQGDAPDATLHGRETILVIDDEAMVLRVVRGILERLGYTVLSADSGKRALEVARDHPGRIHLALLDLGMPVMGGKETFPLLKQARPDMKVMICSGYDRKGDAAALLKAGADGFVSKPFLVDELVPPIRAVLDNEP
ncbi:MAG: PAS domain S-box protein [Gemmatimonadota bacterium]